jgi:hypothetical protein
MLKLGLTNKAVVELNPKLGYPIIRATGRIIQGEPIETVCSHDLTMIQGKIVFNMSAAFFNSIKSNPVKLKKMNSEMDELYNQLKAELLNSTADIKKEDLAAIEENPKFLEKLNSYSWIDFLCGHVSTYTVSESPNADVIWNEGSSIWQVVATREILPDQHISLPKPPTT